MFELFRAGGPLMWVILLCSLVALTIIFERLYSLRPSRIVPANLRDQINDLVTTNSVTHEKIQLVREHSPLGQVYAAGLSNISHGTDEMKHALEESGRQVVHRLSRYLNALGTIASITPLIGLLGTVIGMIKVFTAITANGVGDPTVLSGGISEALITTAAGLSVGIPCLMFYRFLRNKVNELTVSLEEHATSLVDTVKTIQMSSKPTISRTSTKTKKKVTSSSEKR